MIIAGNCSYCTKADEELILKTAELLIGTANKFRCKLWLGGTRPDRWQAGIGVKGIKTLEFINNNLMPCGTEIQTYEQLELCKNLDYIWIGCRNSQNYGLLQQLINFKGDVFIKRGFGMTIDEVIGLYDIMKNIVKKECYIIERGINTFDRLEASRWSPDLKGVIRIKDERPDIFNRLVVDCSHSVGNKNWVGDTHRAFKVVGIKHFMFECTATGKSKTDSKQMLSVKELKEILK